MKKGYVKTPELAIKTAVEIYNACKKG